MTYILAIDQGTTSSRAILFSSEFDIVASAQKEFTQYYPKPGWVEHDAEEIWSSTIEVCKAAIANAKAKPSDIAAIGITNQRETTIIWDRKTGNPIHPAIVWQDRRTAERCMALKEQGHEKIITSKTGLVLDPYFSGTKISAILDSVPGAREKAARGELAFGTVDCFLLWRLTGGRVHATDATNAARTMLLNIHTGEWDEELLSILDVPHAILPDVRDSSGNFGETDITMFGGPIAIRGVAGDQHAATIGQACFKPGMMKSTYGTGCFALMNIGDRATLSSNRLLTTIAYQFNGKRTYALEGSIFIAGAAVQWLRDGLKIISSAAESDALAAEADPAQNVYLVPAFVGLGAPYWDADARGAMFGLTRNSGPREFAKAALESVCFQTLDLMHAMQADFNSTNAERTVLRVDGGMTVSDWTMQRLADILNAEVDRPQITETTALGAAYLAGLSIGLYPEPDEFMKHWKLDRRFAPHMANEERKIRIAGWRDAIKRTLTAQD